MAEATISPKPAGAYVYVILVDGIERYVGKGRGRRAWEHEKEARRLNRRRAEGKKVRAFLFYNRLAKAVRKGAVVAVTILVDGLSDEAAFEREVEEIAARAPDEIWNIAPGGGGFVAWTPEVRAKAVKSLKDYWAGQPERREKQSEWAHRLNDMLWAPGSDARRIQSERVKAEATTPEGRKAMADKAAGMWTDEFRAKRSAETKAQNAKRWADPEQRRMAAERMRARWRGDEWREQFTQKAAENMADPEWVATMRAARNAPENRERLSRQSRERWSDPAFREKCTNSQTLEQRRQAGLKAWVTRRAKCSG